MNMIPSDRPATGIAATLSPLSVEIWHGKYRFDGKSPDPQAPPADQTIEDTFRRVARELARAEAAYGASKATIRKIEQAYYEALCCFGILAGGRITSGAGTGRLVTLMNCFVMGNIEDNLASIFAHLQQAAITMQAGGGIGYDFSTLRHEGAPVRGVGSDASGPISFMRVWNSMCKTIMSAGARRGAMMGMLRCDHPDIEAFIDAKAQKGVLAEFNLSVGVTDAFMAAVAADADWDLVWQGETVRTVRARYLWDRIMRSTYERAEPGVVFIDRVNALNNLYYCEEIRATNPCVTGDTLVMTASGWKRIDSMLGEAQTIVGGDGKLKRIRPAFLTGVKQVVILTTAGGRKLRLTPDHLVMTDRGDVMARNLKRGMKVQVVDAMEVACESNGGAIAVPMTFDTVASVEKGRVEPVFDLTEPDTHHFVANGIVVHNCGEQPLPAYGTCLLGSINLAVLVRNAFEDGAYLDIEEMQRRVALAVRMLDSVIDVTRFPLEEQRQEAVSKRRIGLGVTGFANALVMCRVRYGSEAAVKLTEQWLAALRRAAYQASIDLAREKGPFPLFDAEKYLAGAFIQTLDEDLRAAIARDGIRNSHLLSVAPTGTISIFADNVSSGLEPVFMHSYIRNVTQPDGTREPRQVKDYGYRKFTEKFGEDAELPDYMVTCEDLTPDDHVRMQATVQKYVDSAISKTVNVPVDISFDDFKDVYLNAYKAGCKGLTTYRPNEITGSILQADGRDQGAYVDVADIPQALRGQPNLVRASAEGSAKLVLQADGRYKVEPLAEDTVAVPASGVARLTRLPKRPKVLDGKTYKVSWPTSSAFYVTITDIVGDDGKRRPYEIFVASMAMDHLAWTVALTRMLSAVFRRGGDVEFVVDELRAIKDPAGGHYVDGYYVASVPAAIGHVLGLHLGEIARMEAAGGVDAEEPDAEAVTGGGSSFRAVAISGEVPQAGHHCPSCGSTRFQRSSGCEVCLDCGHSRCG